MKTSHAIIGMAAAAAAGYVIGILTAPEKGLDLQRKIKAGAQDWLEEISKFVQTEKGLIIQGKEELERTIRESNN